MAAEGVVIVETDVIPGLAVALGIVPRCVGAKE